MTPIPRYIQSADTGGLDFSVCSLVRGPASYDRLLASFGRLGFTPENSEFLAADNRDENRFDGYTWQKTLLAEARGRYVIFCHDDIELIDRGYADLLATLDDLTKLDPAWLLAGVAGGRWRPDRHHRPLVSLHISDRYKANRRSGSTPGRVETLDECFILMRRAKPVVGSYDLSGFHYYGPDLCLQAELLGGRAYAIDFHLRHHGSGTKDQTFRDCRERFVAKYRSYFPGRSLHCTTGVVDLGPKSSSES
jgi:hypothetical protein